MKARDDRSTVHLDVTAGARPDAAPLPDSPFNMLLIGDFTARSGRDAAGAPRGPVRVDRDDLDGVLARLAPIVHVRTPVLPDAVVAAGFAALEDFEPDRLVERLALFAEVRALRRELQDPATFRGAADRLRTAPPPPPSVERILTDSLIDDVIVASGGAPPRGQPSELQAFIRAVVAPHVVRDADPRQAEMLERLDAATTDLLRAVMHAPAFQMLEASWRGVDLLVRRLETGPQLRVFLLDAPPQGLSDALDGDAIDDAAIYRMLAATAAETGPWSLLVGLDPFGAGADDLARLAGLGRLARALGAPFVGGAQPELAGLAGFAATPSPETLGPVPDAWAVFRRTPEAAHVGLVAPRLLLRLPYGREGLPTESLAFEELTEPPEHDAFLWGSGALAAALVVGRAFARGGWSLERVLEPEIDRLPLFTYRVDGAAVVKPAAEARMPESTAVLMLERGLIPLASIADRGAVHLVRLQATADPIIALPGRWRRA